MPLNNNVFNLLLGARKTSIKTRDEIKEQPMSALIELINIHTL